MMSLLWILLFFAVLMTLYFQRVSLLYSTIGLGAYFLLLSYFSNCSNGLLVVYWVFFAAIFTVLNVRPLRKQLLTQIIFYAFYHFLFRDKKFKNQALLSSA